MHGPTGEIGIGVALAEEKALEETMSPIDVITIWTRANELKI